ncbi:MAG: hypothetical protein AAGE80_18045 [Pseudomonadota bacterium]
MSFHGEPTGGLTAPVAIAAVTVDGRCRERSPVDMALFGPERDRLVERFRNVSEGQDLLVQATADGSAEGTADLETMAGPMPFRVSLWRQRGGEKIRILAAFAQVAARGAEVARTTAQSPQLDRLDLPLQALITLAEEVRGASSEKIDRQTSDLLSAALRLSALIDDLKVQGSGPGLAEPTLSEVDLGRLSRRVARMAQAGLKSREVAASHEILGENAPPNVLGDERALWDMLDHMMAASGDGMGAGGRLAFRIGAQDRGCALSLIADGAPLRAAGHPRLAAAREIAIAHQAEFTASPGEDGTFTIEVLFPASRCLSVV